MFALVLTALLGAGDEATKATPADRVMLDGNWTVVCMEKDGAPVAEAKNKTVTFKNNTVSFTGDDAKTMKAMRVEFGAKGKVRVTEMAADTADAGDAKAGKDAKTGTYILTKDFLAICLHDDSARASADATSEVKPASGTADPAFEVSSPQAKSRCTLILKRADSSGSAERRE